MDGESFAALSRRVAGARTRRQALGLVLGGAATALLGRAQPSEAAFGFCKIPGASCQKRTECCAGKCKKGVCGCRKNGANASVGVVCCSGHVRRGKCR
jgi:hypothetical protein